MTQFVRNQRGQALVIPFLLMAATFLTIYSFYYFFYASSLNRAKFQLEEIELNTEVTKATGQSVWANENIVYGDEVRIPVNDLAELRNVYGEENLVYLRYTVSTFFIWRETLSLFEITIDHDTDIHADNQLTINISCHHDYSDDGTEWTVSGASWQMFEAPGYIHVGKSWFETYGIQAGDISGNLWGILRDKLGVTPQIKTGWPANVEIYVSEITRTYGDVPTGSIDKIWGEVTLEWGTYAGSIGEIGWIKSLTDLLTVNLPGVPTMVRMVFAVPILLCVGYITALFIKQVFFSI